ncbi:D-sedoheptulose-7-phosphate isomerase [Duganella aceris]|jgi:D-sedoheptulose 7-phosphate isomerase|uniref:Phosphoheptose isomerase n=1 Tax=Duganella aceris TaxID=2703883 RepID=A0ABX0FUF2_9BURK|nr:D-sedoheptulose 7-phosphate isomerase [Duganella aceris]NGZ88028.1 D-sedoheptulose 7-phosphate isomerase [Duganella aceris]
MGNNLNIIQSTFTDGIALKQKILADEAFVQNILAVSEVCIEAFKRGNRVILAGNGGSAADAQHIAAEFVSRFMYDRPGLPSMSLSTDTSMLTAIGNDYGYDKLFLRQLEANGRAGDVFIGITTSGNSVNILKALERCEELGIISVALCGEGGRAKTVAKHALAVPSTSTPRIQEQHITIGHIICEIVEATIFPQ